MSESEHRMIEILRILNEQKKPTGSKLIATELKNKGFNLGERAVRYHMQMLDEKGYTERMGYSGRQITELGKKILNKGLIYDQVDFIYSKFEEMIYLTNFDYETRNGRVVVNKSNIYDEDAFNIIKKVFECGLSVSPYVKFKDLEGTRKGYEIQTICGTTIDGIFLNHGIPSLPLYGGLLEIEDYVPTKFTELISYKKTSITPLDAFIAKDMTSVLNVINEGKGVIPANFRVVPSASREKCLKIINNLKKVGIGGIIDVGKSGENILGIPITKGMIGIAISGGMTPFCAAQELNYDIDIKMGEEFAEYSTLQLITETNKNILKAKNNIKHPQIPFLLSKSWNLLEKVDFNMKTKKGNIISNVSYINKSELDEALEIMENTCKNVANMNPYYKLIEHPKNKEKIGIGTICSLSIDGILINNGIMSSPKYGGLLELTNPPLFIELISYNGSSIDPHKIFISKDMISINKKTLGPKRILASLKEIPFIAREQSEDILNKLEDVGFSIYKIGKPRELTYNAKVDNYNFGIVTGSGLNLIGAIKEKGIDIEVKAMEKIIPFEEMDKF